MMNFNTKSDANLPNSKDEARLVREVRTKLNTLGLYKYQHTKVITDPLGVLISDHNTCAKSKLLNIVVTYVRAYTH